ncbi:MAG: hypothetical protein JWN01_58 [Patescibacteria group bacterium]|jgi:cytoskeletal protein CcmA (bactofilin family)|nr:hypothetical protein [Patescibacteria group bacterium]
MSEEPKPGQTPGPQPKPEEAGSTSISPAPTEVSGEKPPAGAKSTGGVQAEALVDGTVPTVLTPGDGHKHVAKGTTSLTAVYRRADILTTLLTFGGAVIASIIIIAGYTYFTKSKTKAPTNPTKVTTLDKAELDKLNAFFNGNSAGKSAEVLTVSSSTLFKNRVALGSDLKVVGGVQVSGTTALGDLTVDKTSTLGVTNIRGQLTVAGPLSTQSPALLGAGASIKGNLATSGNGTFGGSLSAGTINAADISVTGTLNLAGHLSIAGQTPSVAAVAGIGTNASVEGNDSSGVVTVNVAPSPDRPLGAQLVTLTFRSAYPRVPHVIISPIGRGAAVLQPYILVTSTSFTIGAAVMSPANGSATSYSFSYWVVQ